MSAIFIDYKTSIISNVKFEFIQDSWRRHHMWLFLSLSKYQFAAYTPDIRDAKSFYMWLCSSQAIRDRCFMGEECCCCGCPINDSMRHITWSERSLGLDVQGELSIYNSHTCLTAWVWTWWMLFQSAEDLLFLKLTSLRPRWAYTAKCPVMIFCSPFKPSEGLTAHSQNKRSRTQDHCHSSIRFCSTAPYHWTDVVLWYLTLKLWELNLYLFFSFTKTQREMKVLSWNALSL